MNKPRKSKKITDYFPKVLLWLGTMWIFTRDSRTLLIYFCLFSSALWGQCRPSVLQNLVDGIICEPYVSDGLLELPIEDDICQNSEFYSFYDSQAGETDLQAISSNEIRSGLEAAFQIQSGLRNCNSSCLLENILFKLRHGRTLSCSSNDMEFSYIKLPMKSQGIVSACGRYLVSKRETCDNLNKAESHLPIPMDKSRWPLISSQLDLGQSYSYVHLAWDLAAENACNPSDLKNFKPCIANIQLYPYDSGRASLDPGESISVGFVYSPSSLGLSTAEFVVQTSFRSLLIQAKDLEFESSYRMVPFIGLDIASGGWWSGSLSFSNPFNENIQLEEATLRASFRVGISFLFAEAFCPDGNCQDLSTRKRSDAQNHLEFFHSCSSQQLGSFIGPSPWLGINSARTGHRKMSPSSVKTLKNVGDEYALLNLKSQGITGSFYMVDWNLLLADKTQSSAIESENIIIYAMGKPVVQEVHVINIGGLPIKVSKISISGKECQLDGFYVHVHQCKSFSLEPGESIVLQISYLPNLSSSSLVQRDLELALDTGTVLIPMKACMPLYMLHGSWKTTMWLLMEKCYLAASLVVGFIMFVAFLLLPHDIHFCSLDEFIIGEDENSTAMRKAAQLSQSLPSWRNQESVLVSRGKFLRKSVAANELAEPGSRPHDCPMEGWKQGSNTEQRSSVVENEMSRKMGMHSSSPASRCIHVEDPSQFEPPFKSPATAEEESSSEIVDLTIRTEKQRKRRRKKKKGLRGAGLMGCVEVASSNSGASSPSSPLSPLYAFTCRRPSCPDKEPEHLVRLYECDKNPEIHQLGPRSSVLKAKISVKDSDKSVPFSSSLQQLEPRMASCDFLPVASTSNIPLHARAPGSNLQKGVQRTETNHEKAEDRFTYDIWGKHFSWNHLGDEVSFMTLGMLENECNSFFLYGPQTREPDSRKRCVRSNQRVNNK